MLTLRRAAGVTDDIVVTADSSASTSDLAATIARIDPQARVAKPARSGATVSMADAGTPF